MKNTLRILAASLALSFLLLSASLLTLLPVKAEGDYALTLYVDGSSHPNGHVFFGLSDGSGTKFYGFHSVRKSLALLRMGGGEVRDDREEKWDIRKQYPLTDQQYQQALDAVQNWKDQDKSWWLNHHCGDFAETVAQSAGVGLSLPWTATGHNRPGLFAHYLRQHGGQPNLFGTKAGASLGGNQNETQSSTAEASISGPWRIKGSQTGKIFRIEQTSAGYAVREGVPFILTGQGRILTGDHVFTLAELQKKANGSVPANVQRNLEGKVRGHLTFTLSEDGKTAVYFFEGMGWRANPRTGKVIVYPSAHPQRLILERK